MVLTEHGAVPMENREVLMDVQAVPRDRWTSPGSQGRPGVSMAGAVPKGEGAVLERLGAVPMDRVAVPRDHRAARRWSLCAVPKGHGAILWDHGPSGRLHAP